MRIGQPGMERNQSGFETKARDEKAQRKGQTGVHAHLPNGLGNLRHIERAGIGVDQCHAEEDKGRRHAAQDHVLE